MSNLSITVNLPKDFIKVLQKEINDEIAIAQKKWKITLEQKEKAIIKNATLEQLSSKVATLSHQTWDLGDKLYIEAPGRSGSLELPRKFKENESMSIVLSKKGWEITEEEAEVAIKIEDFYDELLNTIFTWTRTAVFYGVGSYATVR